MGPVITWRAVNTALAVFVALSSRVKADTDYCSLCSDHTMCLYQGDGPACNEVLGGGVSDSDITTIVDEHNKYRNTVASGAEERGNPGPQPSAANMNKLVWNTELATIAQRWADQCTFEHDTCRGTEDFSAGQNIYITWTSGSAGDPNWVAAVQGWYDEVKNFDGRTTDQYEFNSDTGHYTQVVWGTTRYIGCGYKVYKDESDQTSQLYVCDYGPAGNVIGEKMYTEGDPCTSCSDGCDATYTSLCA